jgi:hypothetical protein
LGFGGVRGVVGKPLMSESDLIECISKQLKTKVWKILIFESIFLIEIQTNCQKIGFEIKY